MNTIANPSKKRSSKTAQIIQQAATQLFSEKGFDGTIMDELAEITQVNKASIYYHFHNKAFLYEACLTGLFQTVADAVIQQVELAETVDDKLKAFVQTFALQTQAHRQMPAMLMREIATGGIHMPVPARQQMQRLLESLKRLLKQGEQEKRFRKVDPLTTHFMIIGSLCFLITSEPMRNAIPAEQRVDPTLSEATDEIYTLIINSLINQ